MDGGIDADVVDQDVAAAIPAAHLVLDLLGLLRVGDIDEQAGGLLAGLLDEGKSLVGSVMSMATTCAPRSARPRQMACPNP